jgi:N-acetylglucosaminyldiphosphoundecaprenol N-acetyl-beta-D-mannosaminyltransferase
MRKLVVLLGIPVDNLNFKETLDQIDDYVRAGRSARKGHQVATVNTDFLVKAALDRDLRRLLQTVHLATPDGMPLVWAARLLGNPLQERVTGADLVPALAERAAQKGYSLYLFGAGPGIAKKAADILQERYPGLKIAGVASPPYSQVKEIDRSALDEIRAARPDILLVALGNPKQEKWIELHGRQLGVPVMMGVGGSLDFLAGNVKRAPEWMQTTGLEWLFRLIQEPRRLWRRYVVDLFVFSRLFARQWWHIRVRNTARSRPPAAELVLANGKAILKIQGMIGDKVIENVRKVGRQALAVTPEIQVDVSAVDILDSAGAGVLVALANQAREAGGNVSLVAVPPKLQKTLAVLGLEAFFPLLPLDSALTDAKPVIA